MKKRKKHINSDRRKYLRLKSVFPVEFRIMSDKDEPWQQGFTSDISKGGICLKVNNVDDKWFSQLQEKGVDISLQINIPMSAAATRAVAKIVWVKKVKVGALNQCLMGLEFSKIDSGNINGIVRYGRWMVYSGKVAVIAILFLATLAGSIFLNNQKMRKENETLVEKLVDSAKEESKINKQLEILTESNNEAAVQIESYLSKVSNLEIRINEVKTQKDKDMLKQLDSLKKELAIAEEKKETLELKLAGSKQRKELIDKVLFSIKEEKKDLRKAMIDKMYNWLVVHQNPRTGLIISYEGDRRLRDWAFIYDQALASQAYILFGDYDHAEKAFNFFLRQSHKQGQFSGFANAYYASTSNVAEHAVHCGPNIWLGISLLHYQRATLDATYLPLAKKIADWLIRIQEQDPSGGLRGGPSVNWFATEHNLDGYAFFNMLFEITNEAKYKIARDKILSWLITHAYDRKEIPINRGKGDSTVATDTYAWSIAAIGPKKLKRIKMDPDEIMAFAEDNCGVFVEYERPNGEKVDVEGFDFAKYRNMPRGGVISSEWTAQMVLSFKIMQEYHLNQNNFDKSVYYSKKYTHFLNELEKLLISSSSPTGQGEGCLPYATEDNVDTGHGWRTPQGRTTGSVAGTTYTIFAQKGFNPLKFSKDEK